MEKICEKKGKRNKKSWEVAAGEREKEINAA